MQSFEKWQNIKTFSMSFDSIEYLVHLRFVMNKYKCWYKSKLTVAQEKNMFTKFTGLLTTFDRGRPIILLVA